MTTKSLATTFQTLTKPTPLKKKFNKKTQPEIGTKQCFVKKKTHSPVR